MGLLRHLLLASICCSIICTFTAESTDSIVSCNTDSQNLTSQTSANILKLLNKLVRVASRGGGGYAAVKSGGSANKVYGLAQCRGDVSAEDCSSCLREAAKEIRKRCPDHVDARIWYGEYCFLRHRDYQFFGLVDQSSYYLQINSSTVTEPQRLNQKLRNLMNEISKQAVLPENKGLGKGERKLSTSQTLYALVQCTRDLSPASCARCLEIAVGNFFSSGGCKDAMGCWILCSSCTAQYELYPF